MSVIFPGMDPYLEDPVIWQGFHNRFVVHIADALQPALRPRYITSVEERVFVEGPQHREILPDVWIMRQPRDHGAVGLAAAGTVEAVAEEEVQVPELEVHESFIEILDRQSEMRVVTIIEVLSPTNKFPGPGQASYVTKQREVRQSQTHLVEIDLLRAGQSIVVVPEWIVRGRRPYDYLVCINRAVRLRETCQYYAWRLPTRMPTIRIPLAAGDPDVSLDLQAVLSHTYEAGAYRHRLRYDRPCQPPLSPADQAWANDFIQKANPSA
jgi:hypothetical protein